MSTSTTITTTAAILACAAGAIAYTPEQAAVANQKSAELQATKARKLACVFQVWGATSKVQQTKGGIEYRSYRASLLGFDDEKAATLAATQTIKVPNLNADRIVYNGVEVEAGQEIPLTLQSPVDVLDPEGNPVLDGDGQVKTRAMNIRIRIFNDCPQLVSKEVPAGKTPTQAGLYYLTSVTVMDPSFHVAFRDTEKVDTETGEVTKRRTAYLYLQAVIRGAGWGESALQSMDTMKELEAAMKAAKAEQA